jgi:hypothetical protein
MIDWPTAFRCAAQHVAAMPAPDGDAVVLDQPRMREVESGWLFFYNSQVHLQSGDPRAGLVGNVPFVIDRRDGSAHGLRTHWRQALLEHEQRYRDEMAAGYLQAPAPQPRLR